MNKLLILAATLSLAAPTMALAQDHDGHDHGQGAPMQQHAGWGQDQGAGHNFHQGERMGYNDWSGAQPVDYRQHHLRRPPNGYEWRQNNGQYILAAVATGLIASVVIGR